MRSCSSFRNRRWASSSSCIDAERASEASPSPTEGASWWKGRAEEASVIPLWFFEPKTWLRGWYVVLPSKSREGLRAGRGCGLGWAESSEAQAG